MSESKPAWWPTAEDKARADRSAEGGHKPKPVWPDDDESEE